MKQVVDINLAKEKKLATKLQDLEKVILGLEDILNTLKDCRDNKKPDIDITFLPNRYCLVLLSDEHEHVMSCSENLYLENDYDDIFEVLDAAYNYEVGLDEGA